MSSNSDISLSSTGCLPPINEDCPICHNLDAAVLGREEWLKIGFHGNEEFRRSAAESCLGCRIVRDGVISMVLSTTRFPDIFLKYQEDDADIRQIACRSPGSGLVVRTRSTKPLNWSKETPRPLCYPAPGELRLQFYTLPNRPSIWKVIPEHPEPSLDSTSDEAMGRVKDWLELCSEHLSCRQLESRLPTRVLFISDDYKEAPRLVTSEGNHGAYVALSWRWGDIPPMKTTTENLDDHLRGITGMPDLFRDAVKVTRKLGIRYLWIDALCIIQDCDEDWTAEASKMTEVYGNASLTIAADACVNSSQSLSGKGPFSNLFSPDKVESDRFWVIGSGRLRNILRSRFQTRCPGPPGHGITNAQVRIMAKKTSEGYHGNMFTPPSVLESRGWCLQEILLSRRVLRFGPSEISWQCREMECCECNSHVRVPVGQRIDRSTKITDLKFNFLKEGNEMEIWPTIVENYTTRFLSRDTDRLPAIAGIAMSIMLRNNIPEQIYLSGLWRSHFSSQLVWYARPVPSSVYRPVPFHMSLSRRLDGMPTWSWASVTGSIKFAEETKLQVQEIATPPAARPFVVIRGPLTESGLLIDTREQETSNSVSCLVYTDKHEYLSSAWLDDWEFQPYHQGVLKKIYALQTVNTRVNWCMLLERFQDPPCVGGLVQFKRIGMIFISSGAPKVKFEEQTLALF